MDRSQYFQRFSYFLCGVALAGNLLGGALVDAATRYTATMGSDTNPGTEASPFRTVKKGVSGLKPGDTLYVKSGTYAEGLDNIPGGSSWSVPVTIAVYPGDSVTLKPPAGTARVLHFQGAAKQYISIEGFTLDAANVTYDAVKITSSSSGIAHHIRLRNCEVRNAPQSGILVSLGSQYNEFFNLNVHDNGSSSFHAGLYIQGSYTVLESSAVYDNQGGVQFWYDGGGVHHNVARNNKIYDNPFYGLVLAKGQGNIAYNNLIWGNKDGLKVMGGSDGALVYNNTVYANRSYGISIGSNSYNTQVVNNITYKHAFNGAYDLYDGGPGTVLANNLVKQDPKFVNATAQDFRLQVGSPAIDQGQTLGLVTTDYAGAPRPQANAYDIGAYEYGAISQLAQPIQPRVIAPY